jgi:hypothetical protein
LPAFIVCVPSDVQGQLIATAPVCRISWANLPSHAAVRNTKDAFVAYNEVR